MNVQRVHSVFQWPLGDTIASDPESSRFWSNDDSGSVKQERYIKSVAKASGIPKNIGGAHLSHCVGTLLKANREDVKAVRDLRHANSKITLDVFIRGL